jgi:hypothetical protein
LSVSTTPVPLLLCLLREAFWPERDELPAARDPLLERVALVRRRVAVDPDFDALLFERVRGLRCVFPEVDLLVAISAIPSSRLLVAYPTCRAFSRGGR